jgi:hypothetical protein
MCQITSNAILGALRNLKNPQIVASADEVSRELVSQIPGLWLDLVSLDQVSISALRELWKPVRDRIPETMEEMEATIRGLAILIEDAAPPSLLYIFLDKQEKLGFHRGFPPIENNQIPPKILPVWSKLPSDFLELYTVHNGWYYMHAHSRGHLPVSEWSFLSWEEWLLEDELVKRMPIRPEQTVVVYAQGGAGYLGFELPVSTKVGEATPLMLWSYDLANPRIGIEFWDVFDELTSVHFLDLALRDDEG